MKRFYISIPVLLAAVLGAACSNFDETPPKPGANEAVVGLRADIVPRQQTRAEIDVDFENGLSGSWNEVDILGVIHKAPGSQDFSALGQFAFDPESRTFKGTLPNRRMALPRILPAQRYGERLRIEDHGDRSVQRAPYAGG